MPPGFMEDSARFFELFLYGAMPRVRAAIVLALLAALIILHIAVISASESAAFRGATRWALLVFGLFGMLAAAVPRLRAQFAAEPPPEGGWAQQGQAEQAPKKAAYLRFAKRWGPFGVLALVSLAALGTALAASFDESKEIEQAADAAVFIFAAVMGIWFAHNAVTDAPTPQPGAVTWARQFRVGGHGSAAGRASEWPPESAEGAGDDQGESNDETSSAASAGSEEKAP